MLPQWTKFMGVANIYRAGGVGGAKEKNNYFWLDAIFPAISRQFSGRLTDNWRTVKCIHAARSGKPPKSRGVRDEYPPLRYRAGEE